MSQRKGKVTFGIVLVVTVVLAVTADLILSHLDQPVNGTVTAGQATSNLGFSINLAPRTQIGQYASFDYPKGLTLQKAAPFSLPIVQQHTFIGRDVKSWVLATNVSQLPAGNLANNSAYALRKHDTATYTESALQVNDQAIVVFTDTTAGGFSKVAFISHQNLLGVVSLTGDDERGTTLLNRAFTMTLSSWRWQ